MAGFAWLLVGVALAVPTDTGMTTDTDTGAVVTDTGAVVTDTDTDCTDCIDTGPPSNGSTAAELANEQGGSSCAEGEAATPLGGVAALLAAALLLRRR